MSSPTGTPLVDKVAMPVTAAEVIPSTRDNEEHTNTTSQDNIHSYCHALSVLEVIELTNLLDLHDITVDNVNDSKDLKKDKKHATTPADIDIAERAHDEKALMSDSEPVEVQQNEATSPLHIAFAEETSSQTQLSTTLSTKSSAKIATESDKKTALTSTEPVPTIYPPRRPNIFSKRAPQRNVQWRPEVLGPETTHATEDAENDRGGFTIENLQEFQSETAEQMEKKTERFLGMVRQYSWRSRVVEDLGEAFALED